MKITTLIAAATIATASTAAYAGNPTSAGALDNNVIILPEETKGSSMGSLGGSILPIVGGLVLLGVIAGMDSGGGS